MGGDVGAIDRLDRRDLASTAAKMGPLVLTRDALRTALTALRSGTATTTQAQRWASFMKRGAGTAGPPVDIEWEDEDLFADVLMRMDELGDVIDGTMSSAEIDQHIANLSRAWLAVTLFCRSATRLPPRSGRVSSCSESGGPLSSSLR